VALLIPRVSIPTQPPTPSQIYSTREAALKNLLSGAQSMDNLLANFSNCIKDLTDSAGAAFGQLVKPDQIKIVAAADSRASLVDERIEREQDRVHFDLFKAAGEGEEGGDEAPPADEQGSDEAMAAVPKEEPEKTFFVPDVMMGKDSNRMHWVGTPANGSLFGM
jgi:hypothetical protein